jgi:hypothetical protein
METPEIPSRPTALDTLLTQFASLIVAVLIKQDWFKVPAIASALASAHTAIEEFRAECGEAVTFTGTVYSSPFLPGDSRFVQFATILSEYAQRYGQSASAVTDLAVVSNVPTPFRTDDDLIAYAQRLEHDAREGIRLLRLAAKIVKGHAEGKRTGFIIDVEA